MYSVNLFYLLYAVLHYHSFTISDAICFVYLFSSFFFVCCDDTHMASKPHGEAPLRRGWLAEVKLLKYTRLTLVSWSVLGILRGKSPLLEGSFHMPSSPSLLLGHAFLVFLLTCSVGVRLLRSLTAWRGKAYLMWKLPSSRGDLPRKIPSTLQLTKVSLVYFMNFIIFT